MDAIKFPKPEKMQKKPSGLKRKTPLRAKKAYRYKPKKTKRTESILQEDTTRCFICGRKNGFGLDALEEHHVFEGNGRRRKSEQYGLKVYLCGCTCHREGPEAVHKNRENDLRLKRAAQRKFEERYDRELFMAEFGKNYLEVDE